MGVDLPFELWRPILQDVYATETKISHPPSDYILSKLHSKLNIYRCLASVSRSWRSNARDVFIEDLQVYTIEALRGLVKMFRQNRQFALGVSRLEFSFAEFRCSASVPRKPRPLAPEERPTERIAAPASRGLSDNPFPNAYTPDWKTIHRRDALGYRPSSTAQARHWSLWQGDVAELLGMCSSLSDVTINFTSRRGFNPGLQFHRIMQWFPPPDLTNSRIAEGLSQSTNLRTLILVDPTPIEVFGPTFGGWQRLKALSITLTRSFEELAEATFIPPKSLISLRFHDRSSGKISWPLSSDMGKCTNLRILDLGLAAPNSITMKAIAFLCNTYQHSLQVLILRVFGGTEEIITFQDVLQSSSLHFNNLKRLHLPHASYDTSLFASFKADSLKTVEVGWLTVQPGTGTREEKWSRGLSHPSLQKLSQLIINSEDPDPLRKHAMKSVCESLGIKLGMGYSMVGTRHDPNDDFDIDPEDSLEY
ncbi:hypothetical protein Clacol_004649 [Clathrus columnatus]|uniref:F-box domain-containing protein n=1 Tax=Clathrus columnatus TaxID=1419009 RepID=A0AAV5ACQ3_9AGAM|nr:hypothetical protein Clacol_004649 [Clathrus columnatus]